MFNLFGSKTQSIHELIEKQEIAEEDLREVEDNLGFRITDVIDTTEKKKKLPKSDLETLKGRGSSTQYEDGKIKLKYKNQPDLPALARNGIYAKFIDDSEEGFEVQGNTFEDFLYTEFVASLAEEQVQRTELTRGDISDFRRAHENFQGAKEEAVDAILEGATESGNRELLEIEDLDEVEEKRGEIKDVEALIDARNFNQLDSLYEQWSNSERLNNSNILGSREKSKRMERAAETYQLAKGVIMAREAARHYLRDDGGLAEAEEYDGVKPAHFLSPDEDLFRRTIDYLERAEDAFTGSPMQHVEIET